MRIKFSKSFKILGIVIVSIVVLILIVRGIFSVVAVKKFNSEVERMKAEGKHIELKDFEIQCEDSENAALPWKEIEEMFSPTDEEKKLISNTLTKVLKGGVIDKQERTKIDKIISENSKCFEQFKEVIERPHFKYETDWDKPVAAYRIPSAVPIIQFMKLYSVDTFLKAENGQLNDAIDQCFSWLTFSSTFLDEPFLIQYLISNATARQQIELLNRIISSKKLDDETLFNALKRLDIDVWQKGLIKSVESERVFFIDCAREVLKGNKEVIGDFGYNKFWFWLFRPFKISDLTYSMKIYDEAVETGKIPYYKTSELRKSLSRKLVKIPRYHIFAFWLIPNFEGMFLKKTALEAEILAAKAGIACKIFQNRHGIFPEKLSQLVPDILSEVPTDPFSGKPLIYRRTPSGFIVYSVGSNGKDDGGKETREITKILAEKDDDWVWYEGKE